MGKKKALRLKLRVLSTSLLVFCLLYSVSAQEVIHDFDYGRLEFNQGLLKFEPSNHESRGTAHFLLDTKKYSEYFLAIVGEEQGVVLIDDQVVYQSTRGGVNQVWSIDSIASNYKRDSIVFSVVGFSNTSARVVQEKLIQNKSNSEAFLKIDRNREVRSKKNQWIILLLLIGLTLGFYRMKFPKSFSILFDFADIFRSRLREGILYELRLMQAPNLLHYLVLALLISLYVSKNWDIMEPSPLGEQSDVLALFGIFALALIFPIVKFLVSSFFLELFGHSVLAKFHHMESLRLMLVSLSVGVFWSFLLTEEVVFFGPNILIISLFGLSIGMIFIKLLNRSLDKKLYLFSYICTTEIIPLLFIIKVFK